MEHVRVLRHVRDQLARDGHPFALAGAFALNAYGLGRFTADLDLLVPFAAQDGLVAAMEALGFETLHRSSGFSNHLHPDPSLGRVDFIYVDATTAERLFARTHRVAFAGSEEVLVPHPEHLIAMKARAIKNDPSRRLRDLADVAFLLGLPEVDPERARHYFESLGLEEAWDELAQER